MEALLQASQIVASDAFVFIAVQLSLVFFVAYAAFAGRGAEHTLPAGRQFNYLVLAYSVISASVVQAVTSTELLSGFKLFVTLTDLAAAFYLCFGNPWFRSLVISFMASRRSA